MLTDEELAKLRALKLKSGPRGLSQERCDAIVRRVLETQSISAVAAEFDVGISVVRRVVAKAKGGL